MNLSLNPDLAPILTPSQARSALQQVLFEGCRKQMYVREDSTGQDKTRQDRTGLQDSRRVQRSESMYVRNEIICITARMHVCMYVCMYVRMHVRA